jgi:hypothetical protein
MMRKSQRGLDESMTNLLPSNKQLEQSTVKDAETNGSKKLIKENNKKEAI